MLSYFYTVAYYNHRYITIETMGTVLFDNFVTKKERPQLSKKERPQLSPTVIHRIL